MFENRQDYCFEEASTKSKCCSGSQMEIILPDDDYVLTKFSC